jgi:N-acetylneuraminic acid mutarotase
VPSTRWGHAASTYKGKLYIVGGRNEQDVIDLHEFDPIKMKWTELEIPGVLPKPRRRHSALFVSSSLCMFGGFDGNFYNDLNIIDMSNANKSQVMVSPSTIISDYKKMID